MTREAGRCGLEVIIGNMDSTSLAMAPAVVVGQLCKVVDLDGPVFLSGDRPTPVRYDNGMIFSPPALWGSRPGSPMTDHRSSPIAFLPESTHARINCRSHHAL
jgi:hypothetical protein